MNPHPQHKPSLGADLKPIMEEAGVPAAPAARTPTGARAAINAADARLRAAMARWRRAEDRKWLLRVGAVAAAVLLTGSAVWAAIEFWPRSAPNYLTDPMDEVLDFTLLTKDFNTLPLDQRLAHLKDLIQRLKNMTPEDAAMMAAFATKLQEQARKQLEENAKRLAVDMLDSYAAGYRDVPDADKDEYLDKKILEFTRMMEDLAGEGIGLPQDDGERLDRLKRQAKRDEQRMREGGRSPMRGDQVGKFVEQLHQDNNMTSPVQQARMTRFVRDMVRHLRGESANKPTAPAAPPAPPDSGENANKPGDSTSNPPIDNADPRP